MIVILIILRNIQLLLANIFLHNNINDMLFSFEICSDIFLGLYLTLFPSTIFRSDAPNKDTEAKCKKAANRPLLKKNPDFGQLAVGHWPVDPPSMNLFMKTLCFI